MKVYLKTDENSACISLRVAIFGEIVQPTTEELQRVPGRDCYTMGETLEFEGSYTMIVKVVSISRLNPPLPEEEDGAPETDYLMNMKPGDREFLHLHPPEKLPSGRVTGWSWQLNSGEAWHGVKGVMLLF